MQCRLKIEMTKRRSQKLRLGRRYVGKCQVAYNKPSAATNHIYLFAGHKREKIALPKTTTTTPIGNRDDDNFQKDENKKFHFACK